MINENDFATVYEIARNINTAYSLNSVLTIALQKTAEILKIDTAWIWLTDPGNNGVYLAASHNLPPALSEFPERLSGECYCINQYFSNDISKGLNISEISCSRLWNIDSGTQDLKFHATIPIFIKDKKIGLLNLLTKETRELTKGELSVLNTISELIGAGIYRIRLQEDTYNESMKNQNQNQLLIEKVIIPKLTSIKNLLISESKYKDNKNEALNEINILQQEVKLFSNKKVNINNLNANSSSIQYPITPLTNREIEVLTLIQNGLTNNQIADKLFITERTVKFHISAIFSKLNVKNRIRALNKAKQKGLI